MLISIVITLYNRKELVVRAIESVLSLTNLGDVEIIIVDDGSTDEPLKVIKTYVDSGAVSYFYKDNGGAADAKNYGAERATGDYIIFLDSDDYLENTSELIKYLRSYNNKDISFFYSHSVVVKKGSKKNELRTPVDFYKSDNIYKYVLSYPLNYPGKPIYIFRREKFLGVGGFTVSFKWGDAMLFWRLFLKDATCCEITFPTYIYDQTNENSISRSRKDNYYVNVFNTLSSTYKEIEKELYFHGYQTNWILVLWLISIRRVAFRDFFNLSLKLITNPMKSVKSVFYVLNKRRVRNEN